MKIKTNLFLALSYSILIIFVSLIKIEVENIAVLNITHLDKIIHAGIYFIFCILWFVPLRGLFKNATLLYVFLFSIFYGLLIELLQENLTSYRNFELEDILSNSIGSLISCSFLFLKNNIKKS